jgi:hypothetical protein
MFAPRVLVDVSTEAFCDTAEISTSRSELLAARLPIPDSPAASQPSPRSRHFFVATSCVTPCSDQPFFSPAAVGFISLLHSFMTLFMTGSVVVELSRTLAGSVARHQCKTPD